MAYDIFDSLDDEINYYQSKSKSKTHRRSYPKRTVKYLSPGHTQVTYKHRVLDIHFKQSKKEFETAKKRRSATTRNTKQRATIDRYETAQRHKDLKSDKYTIEDMRSLLRDDHWEEVCHHKRWNYDSNSTVKEFKKYLSAHKRH